MIFVRSQPSTELVDSTTIAVTENVFPLNKRTLDIMNSLQPSASRSNESDVQAETAA